MNHICRICSSNAGHKTYQCSEKMFGRGDEFVYFQCSHCGCLQIAAVPPNLDHFYPQNYYSFHAKPFPQQGWKARLAALRDRSAATGLGVLGRWLGRITPARLDVVSLAEIPARRTMRILDVGCGRGSLLSILCRAGFDHLEGIDPFLPHDIEVVPGLNVRKLPIEEVSEQFDLIMLHHVFEHIESGGQLLQACRARLNRQGKILLRIPTPESDAWEQYHENWVQIDAPRHLFLHTRASLQLLVKQSGLRIEKWTCDSDAFQFWGSELYRKDFSLYDGSGIAIKSEDHFTKAEMKAFERKSKMANARQRGDQAIIVLVPT